MSSTQDRYNLTIAQMRTTLDHHHQEEEDDDDDDDGGGDDDHDDDDGVDEDDDDDYSNDEDADDDADDGLMMAVIRPCILKLGIKCKIADVKINKAEKVNFAELLRFLSWIRKSSSPP